MNDGDVKDYASVMLERLRETFIGTCHMKKKHLLDWMPSTFTMLQPESEMEDLDEFESVIHITLWGHTFHFNVGWDFTDIGWTIRSLSSTG